MTLLYIFRPIKKILFFMFFFILTTNTFASSLLDSYKEYVTTVANAAVSELIPPPISLINDLATNSPELIKRGLGDHIKRKLEYVHTIDAPSGKTPREILELNRDKLQAMGTALETGDNEKLIAILIEEKKLIARIKKDAQKRKDKRIKDTKDNDLYIIKILFERYQARLDTLSQKSKELNECFNNKDTNQKKIVTIRKYLQNIEHAAFKGLIDGADIQCIKAKETEASIIRFYAIVKAGESLVQKNVNVAKNNFSTCKTAADEAFIKSNYNVGQRYFAEIDLALLNAKSSLISLAGILDAINDVNSKLKERESKAERESKYYALVKEDAACIKTMGTNIPQKLAVELIQLKKEIIATKQNYIQYPKEIQIFDTLITKVNAINNAKHISKKEITSLEQRNLHDSDALKNLPKKQDTSIQCISIKPSIQKVKEAEGLHFNALLILQDNKHLLGTCAKKTTPPVVAPTLPVTTTTSPPITSTNSSANNTNTYDAYDVARIVGPTKLYVGDAVTYTAINPNNSNAVYTTGSFTWNNSRQDLLSLGGSGNPVSGVAIKPGRFTLQLTYGERGAAYLDGEIKEKKKKKNIFNMSSIDKVENNDTSKDTKKNSIFNMSSIDKGTPTKTSNCDTYYQEARDAYKSGNLNAAQAVLNKSGDCVEWVYTAQNSLNKAKKNKLCKVIAGRMHTATQTNNVNEVISLQAQAANNQCNISQTIWQNANNIINTQNDAKRDEERRYQASIPSPQPSQTANAMDLFNIVSNGVAAIKQQKDLNDRRKPHPLPNSNLGDKKWQGQSTSSNSSGVRTSNKVSQIIYRVSGSGYVPHYGGKSFRVQGYHDVLVSIKAPATKESILRKANQKYNTDPCKVGIAATPSSKRPPAIWESGPQIKLIKGPATNLSNVTLQNTWRSLGNDGPPLSTLRKSKGCR